MTTTTSARECPICLDNLCDAVVTPCGHLGCGACIKTHARGSSNPYEATCPTCRAPFPTVTPDMSIVPKKYHVFISPALRRVFLGDDDDSRAVIEKLKTEVAALNSRVGALKRDKDLLMDRCEAAQSAVVRLTSDERAARLARDEAREDARSANLKLEELKVDYNTLKLRASRASPSPLLSRGARDRQQRRRFPAKRMISQAALDDSPRASSTSPEPSSMTIDIDMLSNGRPIKPMPKRAKFPFTTTRDSSEDEETVQQQLPAFSWNPPYMFPSPSPSPSSSPSSSSSLTLASIQSGPWPRMRNPFLPSSGGGGDEADNTINNQ